jgi:dephospho-CoA kinase
VSESQTAAAAKVSIGLTGGIGSGKSTVARMLVGLGAALIDTDAIARRLAMPGGAALPALRDAFGAAIIGDDGGLDRAAMRALAFADGDVRRRLESVLHPLIDAEAVAQAAATAAAVCVFDVPLLTESQRWRSRVDRVLVVDCSPETQIARVTARPGWTREAALNAMAAQTTRSARRAIADAVIHNDGITLNALQGHTEALWRLWNNQRPMI